MGARLNRARSVACPSIVTASIGGMGSPRFSTPADAGPAKPATRTNAKVAPRRREKDFIAQQAPYGPCTAACTGRLRCLKLYMKLRVNSNAQFTFLKRRESLRPCEAETPRGKFRAGCRWVARKRRSHRNRSDRIGSVR